MSTEYVVSGRIAAPVEVVWRVLTDVEAMPTWTPSMDSVTLTPPARELGPDAEVVIRQPKMPKATWRVDEWAPMSAFSWTSRAPGVRTRGGHRLVPAPDHATEVTLSIHHQGPLARLVGRLTGERTRQYVQQELDGLRSRCESAAS